MSDINLPATSESNIAILDGPDYRTPPWESVEMDWECCYETLYYQACYSQLHMALDNNDFLNAENFITEQFERFKIDIPPRKLIHFVLEHGLGMIDSFLPSLIEEDLLDLSYHADASYFRYASSSSKGYVEELDPCVTELFVKNKNYYDRYLDAYHNPGMRNLSDILDDMFDEQYCNIESSEEMYGFYKYYGGHHYDVFHLGIWATILWYISPQATPFREDTNELIYIVNYYGSALLSHGTIYDPTRFIRIARPATSCALCHKIKGDAEDLKYISINSKPKYFSHYRYYYMNRWYRDHVLKVQNFNPGIYLVCDGCVHKYYQMIRRNQLRQINHPQYRQLGY